MPEVPALDEQRRSREYRILLTALLLIVVFRAGIFVFWGRSHFDADQAITGLMAKHLAEGRAFPLFYYGQPYMLAVEAWLAAPVFLLAGASVTTLKLPLLGINLAVVWLLFRGLVRDAGLRPLAAAVPALFFALPSAGVSARIVEANGGNVEPFLYVLLIWVLRNRPKWCGFVLAIGFLNREFTLYGLFALLALEAIDGRLFTWPGLRRRLVMLRTAAVVWLVVQWARQYSSAAGPGTSVGALHQRGDQVGELANRICFDLSTAGSGLYRLATEHWPLLFGTAVRPLSDFSVVTGVTQGLTASAALLAVLAMAAVLGILRGWWKSAERAPSSFCAFLVLTGLWSVAGYAIGRCGNIDFFYMRYEMLSILGMAGLGAWFLQQEPSRIARRAWMGLALVWFAIAAAPHVRLYSEYLTATPRDIRQYIIENLEARGTRYALADYWIATPLTFLSNEKIIVASTDFTRVLEYERVVNEHLDEAVLISRSPCAGGEKILDGVYLCDP